MSGRTRFLALLFWSWMLLVAIFRRGRLYCLGRWNYSEIVCLMIIILQTTDTSLHLLNTFYLQNTLQSLHVA